MHSIRPIEMPSLQRHVTTDSLSPPSIKSNSNVQGKYKESSSGDKSGKTPFWMSFCPSVWQIALKRTPSHALPGMEKFDDKPEQNASLECTRDMVNFINKGKKHFGVKVCAEKVRLLPVSVAIYFGSGDGEPSTQLWGNPAVDGRGVGSESRSSCATGRGVVISSESISISSLPVPGRRGNISGGVSVALSSSSLGISVITGGGELGSVVLSTSAPSEFSTEMTLPRLFVRIIS
jgi:hypothetical protein